MAAINPATPDASPSGFQDLKTYVESTKTISKGKNKLGPGSLHSSPTLVGTASMFSVSSDETSTIEYPSSSEISEDEAGPEEEEGWDPEAASISSRVYIYPLPYPPPPGLEFPYSPNLPHWNPFNLASNPAEPTSTLVLSSPSGWFVDVRFLKPIPPNGTLVIPPGTPELPQDFDTRRLEWAFAGHASSEPIAGVMYLDQPVRHSIWTHWIDSRFHAFSPPSQIPPDEGDMYTLPSGDVLEVGSGLHPVTNHMVAYEELWRDIPILSTRSQDIVNYISANASGIPLSSMAPPLPSFNGSPTGLKHCILLRLQNASPAMQERGLIIRLGQYIQGFYKRGEENCVERWEYKIHVNTVSGDRVEGEWEKVAWCGGLLIPCSTLFEGERVKEGMRVSHAETVWVVEESFWWED
ncbi:hypothetical protein P154DRAFT_558959 [Amniculicola lignicola CBS 123094]|uniref:Protein HRI1 n=1 Tax=Amniculicola lignicola CBS 123094 TaxID=1392246 RepID=A0A6A5X0G9_9PLEO|nr:hypothetical protein P154DRAFT_558959 [Amniculicola lignicola CBS 123094]